MKNSIPLFLFSTLFLFQACQENDQMIDTFTEDEFRSYSNVPPAMWDYFQRFEEEAEIRSIEIDLAAQSISGEISEISEQHVAGSCTYGSNHPGHIIIDLSFWNQTSDLTKEMIIFHELGHCSLYRNHREGAFSNGACLSIMRSGLEDCIDNYHFNTRAVYLDELFGVGI